MGYISCRNNMAHEWQALVLEFVKKTFKRFLTRQASVRMARLLTDRLRVTVSSMINSYLLTSLLLWRSSVSQNAAIGPYPETVEPCSRPHSLFPSVPFKYYSLHFPRDFFARVFPTKIMCIFLPICDTRVVQKTMWRKPVSLCCIWIFMFHSQSNLGRNSRHPASFAKHVRVCRVTSGVFVRRRQTVGPSQGGAL